MVMNKTLLNDVFELAKSLIHELECDELTGRLNNVPQLGVIKVRKKDKKTREEYVERQLKLHMLIKNNLNADLEYSYGGQIPKNEYISSGGEKITLADTLQILVIIYNMGHFRNTFVSSRAVLKLIESDDDFCEWVLQSSNDYRFIEMFEEICSSKNYYHIHLLNSFLVLEHCNKDVQAVEFGKELLYRYIIRKNVKENGKIAYAFKIFKAVRDITFIGYDLSVAKVPWKFEFDKNKEGMIIFLRERLMHYNDHSSVNNLLNSMSKLLADQVYNNKKEVIAYSKCSEEIFLECKERWCDYESYWEIWENMESPLNIKRVLQHRYVKKEGGILKLTFSGCEKHVGLSLEKKLQRMNCVEVGSYLRNNGDWTVVISLKTSCKKQSKIAFEVLKKCISSLRQIEIEEYDVRYLLVTKFFLFYAFRERKIEILPTIHNEKCLFCARGSQKRVKLLTDLIEDGDNQSDKYEDKKHEIEWVRKKLKEDKKNDVAIVIPGSVLIMEANKVGKKCCEFDGMVIFPNRKKDNIILFEAKNTITSGKALKYLRRRLNKLEIEFQDSNIYIEGQDAFINMTITESGLEGIN